MEVRLEIHVRPYVKYDRHRHTDFYKTHARHTS